MLTVLCSNAPFPCEEQSLLETRICAMSEILPWRIWSLAVPALPRDEGLAPCSSPQQVSVTCTNLFTINDNIWEHSKGFQTLMWRRLVWQTNTCNKYFVFFPRICCFSLYFNCTRKVLPTVRNYYCSFFYASSLQLFFLIVLDWEGPHLNVWGLLLFVFSSFFKGLTYSCVCSKTLSLSKEQVSILKTVRVCSWLATLILTLQYFIGTSN